MKLYNTVSERIKILQTVFRLTEAELAKTIGVSQGSINRVCRGETKPSFETLVSIVEKLDVQPAFILMGDGPIKKTEFLNWEDEGVCGRIAKAMEQRKFSIETINLFTEIDKARLEKMIAKEVAPSLTEAHSICKALNVTMEWLATGDESDLDPAALAIRIKELEEAQLTTDHYERLTTVEKQLTALEERLARAGL